MTRRIKLSLGNDASYTNISNIFIDNYMADAHGSYVKVYIYLLRCLSDVSMPVSIANLSDKLDETEKDILKALRYWEKQRLLGLEYAPDGQVSSIEITDLTNPMASTSTVSVNSPLVTEPQEPEALPQADNVTPISPVLSKPNYTNRQLEQFRQFDDFNNLIDYIEGRFGRTLSPKDLQTPAFIYEVLGFEPDLIRYLYDYCILKNKQSAAYIEKIARTWATEGIDTLDKAKLKVLSYSKEYSALRNAFGLSRALGAIELDYLNHWTMDLHMSPELIQEACNRALLNTGKPDFKYTDGILNSWHKESVSSKDQLAALDAEHQARSKRSSKTSATAAAAVPKSGNKFAQFPQRQYTKEDYSSLELKKLGI